MVDVTFDCRMDAGGRDPDSHSPTLRSYHQFLWSKPLPSGKLLSLDISGRKSFLVHLSELGDFHLTSDSITHGYSKRRTIAPLVGQLPEAQRDFVVAGAWLVGESIVFPGKRIDRKNTINAERGMNHKIGDRFDLTLECIRRHYFRKQSPLSNVIDRYSDFFALFEDFQGYADFFLLQDLVTESYRAVRFYLPFNDFEGSPFPTDLDSYSTYLQGVQAFAAGRARRIVNWCDENSSTQ